MKRNPNNLIFPLVKSKQCCPFWGPNKMFKHFLFLFLFLASALWNKSGVVAKKKKKLWSLWFFEKESFAVRTWPNLPIFWNWIHKNLPDLRQCVKYWIRKKCEITPPYTYCIVHEQRVLELAILGTTPTHCTLT